MVVAAAEFAVEGEVVIAGGGKGGGVLGENGRFHAHPHKQNKIIRCHLHRPNHLHIGQIQLLQNLVNQRVRVRQAAEFHHRHEGNALADLHHV